MDIYKKEHPGKQFIIEKGVYESDVDMIDKLDEMGQELEEKENQNMKNKPVKVKSLAEAILHAKENNKKKIKINNESIDVEEYWNKLQDEEGLDENEEECVECGEMKEGFDEYVKDQEKENKSGVCSKCGKDVCECSPLKESKSKKIRLKESDFVKLISDIVTEAMKGQPGIPGIPGVTVTKKAQEGSKKENSANVSDVEKKMKDYLSFDGNDNPEFPNQIGGNKMAVHNTEKEEDTVEDNRGRMMVDINYDNEPTERFKKRAEDSLNGDSRMGNPKDAANAIPSKLGTKIKKDGERSQKLKKEEPFYHKEPTPIKSINESKEVKNEILKMKKLTSYNKKTQ